jgi:outer membrane protein OmpA-like peptidoglycan-associated protein
MSKTTTSRWLGILAATLVVAGLAVGGFLLWQRFDALERHAAELSENASRSAQDARTAAEKASNASATAAEATQRAETAEAARQSAVSDRTQAEQARLQAEQAKASAENTATEATKRATIAQSEVERVRKEREAELNRMQELLNRIVETRRTSSGLVMNLSDRALHFEFDSAALGSQSRELLSRIAGILLASGGYGLAIHGHTDDVGTAAYNQGLSERRAESVKQYLASAGVDAGIISVKGFGKSSPIAQGHQDSARAMNRRVEIVLTDTRIKYEGEAR